MSFFFLLVNGYIIGQVEIGDGSGVELERCDSFEFSDLFLLKPM